MDHIERLRNAFRHARRRYRFNVEAIVILPDRLHTLWRLPLGDADFSTRWILIKRYFSSGAPRQDQRLNGFETGEGRLAAALLGTLHPR